MIHGFAYTQSRVQSRFAELADDAVWQRLEAVRSLSGFIEEARHTALAHWVGGLSVVSDHRHIEQDLRRRFREQLTETRRWTPTPWRAAVEWTGWLPELPLLQGLAEGRETRRPAWQPPPQLIAPAPAPIAARWLTHWRTLWPSPGRRQRLGLEQLIELIGAHLAGFADLPPAGAWDARLQLAHGLRRLFRRQALQPAALFAALALSALEFERLRGALVVRALFPDGAH